MKKSILGNIFCLCLALCPGGPVFSLPDQKLIYPGEWPYEALTALSLEKRTIFFSGASLTVGRFKAMLSEIDGESLSPAGKVLYERLGDYLAGDSCFSIGLGAFSFDADPALNPELYLRTEKDLDFIYDNYRRRSLAVLPLALSFSPYLSAGMDIGADQTWDSLYRKDNYTNLPLGNTFSFNMPRRAYLNLGLPLKNLSGILFRIGIGEDFVGRTRTGSIILSDRMKDVSYAALSLYSPVAEYGATIAQLDTNKYFYFHHIDARFFKRVSLSLVEGLLVNAPMELRYLNPVMIYHSFSAFNDYGDYNVSEPALDPRDSRTASFFGTRLDVQLVKHLRFYGLCAFNEVQTIGERENEPDVLKADSLAFQAGLESMIPVSRGYWSFGVEGVYTYPFVYISRDKRWSFYKPETGKSGEIRFWTGSPFGPDSLAATAWGGFHAPSWSLSASFLFLVQGERSSLDIFDYDDYHPWRTGSLEETRLKTPTGIPGYTSQAGLSFSWSPKGWLTLKAEPGYSISVNHNHREGNFRHGFEAVFAVRVTPPPLRIKGSAGER
jgi:hypothetical protein